jgi:putative acetyltransferase
MNKRQSTILIQPYEKNLKTQILSVWERSVLATHHFLRPEDFITIKALVHTIDFSQIGNEVLVKQNSELTSTVNESLFL